MSDSEIDYLQPGFDPSTLTNPRLRSILVTYNVHYASNAKKPDLVELFNEHVAPQASKILARRARAKRSSMGIMDVGEPAESHSTANGFGAPTPRRPAGRARRAVVEPPEEEEAEPEERRQRRSSPRKRQSRSTSYQPAAPAPPPPPPASDTDTGLDVDAARARPSARRGRTKTPQVKLEPPEEESVLARVTMPRSPAPSSHGHHRHSSTDDEKVFTDHNPFQSGSSPLAPPSTQRRRTSARSSSGRSSSGFAAAAAAAESPSLRRRTAADVPVAPSASSSFTYVASRASPSPSPSPGAYAEEESESDEGELDALQPGEEFTPEAQLELAQEEEEQRRRTAAVRRGKKGKAAAGAARRRSVWAVVSTPLLVLTLTLAGAYAVWYRQEKMAVGYCGLGRPAVPLLAGQLAGLQDWAQERLPDWAYEAATNLNTDSLEALVPAGVLALVEPQCEPCPPHAFCYSDFSVRCESGYLLKPHPLALGGLVPLPPTCEPDGERARRVKAVADKAVEALRDRRAKWECGDLVNDDGAVAASPAIDEPVLKEAISDKRSKKMSRDEFDDLWTAALGEMEAREEVEVELVYETTDPGAVSNTRLSSTSLARLPLTCALRRSVRLALARHRFSLCVLILAVLAGLYARARFRRHRATLARVPALVDLALARLAAQKELWLFEEDDEGGAHEGDDELRHDPFLFLPQLRDDVLRSTHSLAARERIWRHVRAVVEQNSNVRAGQREGRNGEVGRAWEWIGPVGLATGDVGGTGGGSVFERSATRRRSGRVSAAPERHRRSESSVPAPEATPARPPTPAAAADAPAGAAAAADRGNRSALHKRWQDSRPVF